MINFKDLIAEFRCFKSTMEWTDAMDSWLSAAHEMYFRGLYIPPHWEFKPVHVTKHDPDDAFANEVIVHADSKALIKFGNLMLRYTLLLEKIETRHERD